VTDRENQGIHLDQNRIAIRQRSFVDVLDLALRTIRVYTWQLAAAFALGVLPIMALNAWLLADFAEPDVEIPLPSETVVYMPGTYMMYMVVLLFFEVPLATAPITLYLGQALFTDRPQMKKMAGAYFCSLSQLLSYQLVLRVLLVVLSCGTLGFLPFVFWPYLSEVILLERNPMWSGRQRRITTQRRTFALHGRSTGDLFVRWMGATIVGVLLVCSAWLSIWVAGGMLLNDWAWEGPAYTVCFPLALWLVAGYLAVVRFLAYLDLRIRREGWEVELMVRAEEARLTRRLA